MKQTTSHFRYYLVLILLPVLLLLFFIDLGMASASTEISFSWKPNPPQEFVAGYRLYYGSQSRFNSDKSLKTNFSYDFLIDFVDQTRCTGPNFSSCTHLSSNDLQCQDLFAENPRCTVSNLHGVLYFAMTAYTNSAESSFTYELKSENHFATELEARISADTAQGSAPLVTTFDASTSTGEIVSYEWDFGDGDTATGARVSHTFLSTGTYAVRLTVTDPLGAFAQKELGVTVTAPVTENSPPTAILSSTSSVGNAPLQVTFDGSGSTDSDGTILSYSWALGDGGQASGATVTYTYTDPGTYHPTLSVTDDGGLTDSASTLILVQPSTKLEARISADTVQGTAPLVTTFDASTSTGEIVSYEWDFGNGASATGAQVSHTFLSTGTYAVHLTVTDPLGAFAQKELSVTVTAPAVENSPPTAIISSTSSVGDAPLQVTFDGSGSTDSDGTILSYNWELGDGGQASGATVTYTYTNLGTYHPTLTVTDDGGLTNSASTPVLVQPPTDTNKRPVAVISLSSRRGTLPLQVSLSGSNSYDEDGRIVSYKWNFDDGTTTSGQNVEHTFTQPADYTISLFVTDDFGATSQPATMSIGVQDSLPDPERDVPNILPIIYFLLI